MTKDNDLLMGRYRRMYEAWIFGKRVNALTWPAEAFFLRVNLIADDYGNFPADPFMLIAKAGGLRAVTDVEVTDWVKEMERKGLIRLYLVDQSDWYGHILSFTKTQPPTGSPRGGHLGRKRSYPESPWDSDIPLSQQPKYTTSSTSSVHSSLARDNRDNDEDKDKDKEQDHTRVKGTSEKYYVLEGFKYWHETLKHPNAKLSPERVRVLEARWKDSTLDELLLAIDGCESSDFHMGRQPNNPERYDDITLIARNRSKLEWFGEKVQHKKKQPDEKKSRSEEAKRRWHGKG